MILAACGASSSSPPPDAAPPDAAPLDAAASPDAGSLPDAGHGDASPSDASSSPDATAPDATAPDAAPLDAAPPDAGCCEDDGISCTREVCGEDGACTHEPDDVLCASEPCEIGRCDVGAGGCVSDAVEDGIPCGPAAAFGGPPPICLAAACTPPRLVGIDYFGAIPLEEPEAGGDYYWAVPVRLDDVDGDGMDDVVLHVAPVIGMSAGGEGGTVSAYSLGTGQLLWSAQRVTEAQDERDSRDVVSPGDLNGDGNRDVAFPHLPADSHEIVALDGATGDELWRVPASDGRKWLGTAGDHDGDGTRDLVLVGATSDRLGFAAILSGRDGSTISSRIWLEEEDVSTWLLAGQAPDMDGDGLPDFLAASDRPFDWLPVILGSAELVPARVFEPPPEEAFGAVGTVPDATGDGLDEVLVYFWGSYDGHFDLCWALDADTGEVVWENASALDRVERTWDLNADGTDDSVGTYWTENSPRRLRLMALSGADGATDLALDVADAEGTPLELGSYLLRVSDVNGDQADDWVALDRATGQSLFVFASSVDHFEQE
ncbi:MAG: PQQ-binding-like beta-propeller repeat protein [Deltaproteobacteria bacterium]|nr:PQQ-binding-like beta-propeller repeat protein [Deltaproteobacteria bacterium]